MRSRRLIALQTLACLLLTWALLPGLAVAQVKTFVVFPFNYMGPEKYQHYGKGASSRIQRKLTVPGTLEPAADATALSLGRTAPVNASAARGMLSGAGTDYLVWGSIGIAGDTVSLEVTLQSLTGDPMVKSAEVPLDEVTMELDRMATEMTNDLFNTQQQTEAAQKSANAANANPSFLSAQAVDADQYTAAAVNPQFRYEGGAQNTGRWQSQGLRFASRGMIVCDATGNGKNEIFLLKDHSLEAYRFEQERLMPLGEVTFAPKADLISIQAIDLDKDGASELVVSTYRDEAPLSYIYRFNGSAFSPIVDNIRLFLNVVRMPPTYTPTLIGQPKGHQLLMDSSDVREVYVSGKSVVDGKKIAMPPFGNIYNFTYLPEENGYKVIMLNKIGQISVFTQELKPDTVSQETYNNSAIPLELPMAVVAGLGSRRDVMEQQYYYVPLPMLVTNMMTGSDKYELMMNKDITVAAQVFKRFRTFTQGEIHALFWDGTGMNLSWKTRRIKGTVVGYDIADFDNDGQPELLVLVNTYPGAIQLEYRKTVLFAYDLNLQ
ncbi:MAG: hypothetical protein AB7E32_16725 [Desulfovibrio sp.]